MIDWQRVEQLKSEIGPDDFNEVVVLFLEEVDEVIERLKISPKASELGADFHFLKGSALNLGFRAFANLCQAGETKAKSSALNTAIVGEVIDCYAQSRACFLDGLSDAQRQAS